jgi:putative transposase
MGIFTSAFANSLLLEHIDALRLAFICVRRRHAYQMEAVVVLPDHLHCIWTLPPGDDGYSVRWGLIKSYFSRSIEKGERISESRIKRGERGLWQRRFGDHLIRDDADHRAHLDYIHYGIRSSMGWSRMLQNGNIPASTALSNAVCTQQTGEVKASV